MSIAKKYIGLDVSKAKIAVAIADEGRSEARFWGIIEHTKERVLKLLQQLQGSGESRVELDVCYEAGPTGYMLHRWLLESAISCTVILPTWLLSRVDYLIVVRILSPCKYFSVAFFSALIPFDIANA